MNFFEIRKRNNNKKKPVSLIKSLNKNQNIVGNTQMVQGINEVYK